MRSPANTKTVAVKNEAPGLVSQAALRRVIDRGIAASEKDYEEGRSYGPFETHEALVASLHAEAAKLRKKKNNSVRNSATI